MAEVVLPRKSVTLALTSFHHIANSLRVNVDKTKAMTTYGSHTSIHLDGAQMAKDLGPLVQEKKVASITKVHSRILLILNIIYSY